MAPDNVPPDASVAPDSVPPDAALYACTLAYGAQRIFRRALFSFFVAAL